jgi:hypothetical protein
MKKNTTYSLELDASRIYWINRASKMKQDKTYEDEQIRQEAMRKLDASRIYWMHRAVVAENKLQEIKEITTGL